MHLKSNENSFEETILRTQVLGIGSQKPGWSCQWLCRSLKDWSMRGSSATFGTVCEAVEDMCESMCLSVSLPIEKVLQFSVSVVYSFVAASASWRIQPSQSSGSSELQSVWEFVFVLLMNSQFRIVSQWVEIRLLLRRVASINSNMLLWRVCCGCGSLKSVMKVEFSVLRRKFRCNSNRMKIRLKKQFWERKFSELVRRNLVDPASSHMLVSKIKPCMFTIKSLHDESANGSLKQFYSTP